MVNFQVPFYANTPDDTHCFQATMKMVYEYFKPDDVRTFEEWDAITKKQDGLWTWPMAGLIWVSHELDVKVIEVFDYDRFAELGKTYLEEIFGKEVADEQGKMSDIKVGQALTKTFSQKVAIEKRLPTMSDIIKFLDDGYLVTCAVNACTLSKKEGYVGHSIVVKGYTDEELILHDPGLPARENYPVSKELFQKAWAYPNDEALNLTALKLKRATM